MFDDEYKKKLDVRSYVSPSADGKANVQSGKNDVVSNLSTAKIPIESTKVEQRAATHEGKGDRKCSSPPNEDVDFEVDSNSIQDETEIPAVSLFSYNMPGVLKREEVEKLDLDHWKLVVRNTLVEMEVSSGDTLERS